MAVMRRVRVALVRLSTGHRMLMAALAAAVAYHGGLLATGSFRRTYDAYVHIFFADHYARGWFETWEPRWYTGFTVTSYPPGSHQLVALVSRATGLEAAFALVQLMAILVVVVGVYRLAWMIGGGRVAGYAAVLSVMSTSIAEAVHVFGQLPSICALGLLLNALPHVRRWVTEGDRRDLAAATALLAATTAFHHVTTLFGAVFFLGPVVASGLLERFGSPMSDETGGHPVRIRMNNLWPLAARRLRRVIRPLGRTVVLGAVAVAALVVVVLPYWIWSSRDPISQVPIPHASRVNFLEDLNAGLVFWAVPWGPMLLAIPHAVGRGLRFTTWPYLASLSLLTLLGTGGTTPLPRLLLGGAFEILTLDRFTFWATILILPFAGMAVEWLVHGSAGRRPGLRLGRAGLAVLQGLLVLALIGASVFTSNLPRFRPMQPERIDPAPIVAFLDKDQHDRWRYLTLGFGDQMAWLSALTSAQTVDGNYHSARRLPELISSPVERLEGAKFRGVPGLGSLQQFLGMPERYHLKFVFSNDHFYDPLLQFSGWRPLQRLENGVVVWEREDVSPLPAAVDHPELPFSFRLMWGLLPPMALLASGLSTTLGWCRPRPAPQGSRVASPLEGMLARAARFSADDPGDEPRRRRPAFAGRCRIRIPRLAARGGTVVVLAALAAGGWVSLSSSQDPVSVVEQFYEDLDYRRFEQAWALLSPEDRPTLDEYLLRLSVEDGLFDSYSSLASVTVTGLTRHPGGALAEVELVWITALEEFRTVERLELLEEGRGWSIRLPDPDPTEPTEYLARRTEVVFEAPGRRTVTTAATAYDDVLDRPELQLGDVRLVLLDGRPAVVGEVRNADADPAFITVAAGVGSEGSPTLRANARHVVQHSLLPGETTPYRADFEGIAGLDTGEFDPAEFTRIDLPARPELLRLDAAAVVTTRGLDRPVSIQGVVASIDDGRRLVLEGEVLNLGTEDVTVVGVLVGMYDLDDRLVWVDWVLVSRAARPGLSAGFRATLTSRERLRVVDLPATQFANGLPAEARPLSYPTLSVPAESGYSGLSLTAVVFQRPQP